MKIAPVIAVTAAVSLASTIAFAVDPIVHDADYYVLEAQHGQDWREDNKSVDDRLQVTFPQS